MTTHRPSLRFSSMNTSLLEGPLSFSKQNLLEEKFPSEMTNDTCSGVSFEGLMASSWHFDLFSFLPILLEQ